MSEQRPEQDPNRQKKGGNEVQSRVKKRIAIAAALVAVALAAIPVLNSLNKGKVEMTEGTPQASSGRIQGASAPVASAPAASAPAASAPAAEAEPGLPKAPAIEKTPAIAGGMATAPGTQPAIHAVPGQAPARAPAAHAPSSSSAPAPTGPVAAPAPPPASVHKAAPAAVPQPQAAPKPQTKPVPQPVTVPTPAAAPTPVEVIKPAEQPQPGKGSFGYNVQLGLFSSLDNVQKFVAALKAQGIPVKTETRVQVGPFRSRAEADEMMGKLKSLGYQPLLQPAAQ